MPKMAKTYKEQSVLAPTAGKSPEPASLPALGQRGGEDLPRKAGIASKKIITEYWYGTSLPQWQ